jgi:TDG/mug DNA glycosylase family protein
MSRAKQFSTPLDVLASGLSAVFCGLNRPPSAAQPGSNFATPSNRFWTVLHLAGFTDVRLAPHEEQRLLEYGWGITAVVPRFTRRAEEVSAEEFRRWQPEFEARIRHYAPRAIAFLGKRAFAAMTDQTHVEWGRQALPFADALAWVLPNPSGRNRSFTLDALVREYAKLRAALAASHGSASSPLLRM